MQDKKEMQDKMEEREALIDEVIEREWEQFQYVQNEGGRASCQDDHETFVIMRKSQFMNWTQELLESYRQDLIEAEAAHWNLLTEKYARMMESTAPVCGIGRYSSEAEQRAYPDAGRDDCTADTMGRRFCGEISRGCKHRTCDPYIRRYVVGYFDRDICPR